VAKFGIATDIGRWETGFVNAPGAKKNGNAVYCSQSSPSITISGQ